MLDWLGNIAGSILGGGVTGILGVAVQRFADFQNKKLDLELSKQRFEHEISLRKVDAEIQAQEWASRTRVAEVEASGREAAADSAAFAASFQEPQHYSGGAKLNRAQLWVMVGLDALRGIVRPGLTIYLCVLTTVVYLQARQILAGAWVSPDEAYGLMRQIVGTILYLCTTCLLWWFGVRNKGKGPV